MRATVGQLGIALAIAALVAGCSSDKKPQLMHLRNTSSGPDEFGIVPTKALQMPTDLSALPVPTPGGTNLTDPTPRADAIAVLGGKPQQAGSGIPAADGALVAAADRYGNTADIRQKLAAEDLTYRQKHNGRLLDRLFGHTLYFEAYAPMSLDPTAEIQRWRALGVQTPAAPPTAQAEKALPTRFNQN